MSIDLSKIQQDLDEPVPHKGGAKCAVQKLAADFPEAVEVIRGAIADHTRSAERVAQVLTRNGLKISDNSIKRHRQGLCQQCREATA